MEKPEYDYESLKAGVENIDKGIATLTAAIRGAEQQKAQAAEVIRSVGVELTKQQEQRAEFSYLIARHEVWRSEEQPSAS